MGGKEEGVIPTEVLILRSYHLSPGCSRAISKSLLSKGLITRIFSPEWERFLHLPTGTPVPRLRYVHFPYLPTRCILSTRWVWTGYWNLNGYLLSRFFAWKREKKWSISRSLDGAQETREREKKGGGGGSWCERKEGIIKCNQHIRSLPRTARLLKKATAM